ncbi:DExH-box ATP-dependent RNA helicase DExH5, mitochondrial-like [Telopea speciosissima]|uniref:DExH-box ATP-dependent RNA helicase DExH5, mitochondrial-like n=1 Tax=Telopea speciosissima TaxID=54955 RepID=UPI001CC5D95E|nr:DExH-box ATP-dependent RNA helicase DExH5, mitochondrial-like [Telopea speciosissima]
MPYSAFLRGYLRTGPYLTMSLRPTALQFQSRSNSRRSPETFKTTATVFGAMKDRAVAFGSVYVPPRLRSVITSSANSGVSTRSLDFDWRDNQGLVYSPRGRSYPSLQPQQQQQSFQYGRYAYDDYSDDDSERETESSSQVGASTLDNIDEWNWKLTMLIRNKDEQEVVSREKKDRRDFEKLAALANRMGLYSRQYEKVVVFSKLPLPNYRSDLDAKRPQREVTISFGLQRRVDAQLREYLSQKPMSGETFSNVPFSRSSSSGSIAADEGFFEQPESQRPTSVVMEKILRRRSLQLRNQQQAWQESPEGQKMLEFRRSLPAYKERDALLAVISQNQVVVISGETGCGKTTQLPQYILESEIEAARGASCSIICTQPRRISAMSVSERVAQERGEKLGESVGYKVRLEGVKGRDTRLLFCTTGILLRRLLVDRNLKGVTHVIVDEIHERGMNEDFLLIVLKELLPRRPELRLILMSATLNAELFSSYFGGAPMVHIPGFTYPVRAHFLENVLEITGYRLTPYNQIDDYGQGKMWKMQKQAIRKRKSQIASVVEDALEAADFKEHSLRTQESVSCWNPDSIGFNLIENVLCHICKKERSGAILVFMTGWDDINALKEQLQTHPLLGDASRVLLLACHGSMPSSEQRLIFEKPEDGVRKIVLATNMAETSITINDVVFVVDCGKAKETSYDALNNTPCLLPSWISKAATRQRRGRAGRVQPGECYHLYPRCVYDAFSDYQLPELLRTPLQSLCLQIKSLQLGSISEFLSRALQSPELLSVQNAIEYLKIIGALDENENLTVLGRHLSMLPVEPKLGKMIILGAMFNCLDPILIVVAGLSARDPFLAPFDKKELAESARAQFYARDYSDHLALVRAYEGWRNAEREQSGYEYCWKNFLSAQTLKAIDSLRRQFFSLLKDIGLVDDNTDSCNAWSHDKHLVRAVICAGLFPGICSVVNKEKSISLKTMEDGQVLLYSNTANARELKIPYPWLVFNEKVKVNSVFLRDSTAVSDSVVLLFGGNISRGGLDGHLKMLGGDLEFFMKPALADTYLNLKRELDELIQNKLLNPKMQNRTHEELLSAVRLLISEDRCEGRFVFGRQVLTPSKITAMSPPRMFSQKGGGPGGDNSKSQLQTLLTRAGHEAPTYKTKPLKGNQFRTTVEFNGMQFLGNPCQNKKLAEKDAAAEALKWLTGGNRSDRGDIDNMSMLLKKSKKKHNRRT